MRKFVGALGLLVVGCAGAGTEEQGQSEAAATADRQGAAIDQKFRADVALLQTALQVCGTHESLQDPACGRNVVAQLRGGAAIETQGLPDLQSIYRGILQKIGSYAKGATCPYLESWKGFDNLYYARGASVTAGAVKTGTAGIELVYDIGDRQMAVFYYTGHGWGNVVGMSVGAYAGFGFSKSKHGLFDAWSGSSWSHNVNAGIPEVDLVGVGVSKISNEDGSVVGGTANVSIGINIASVLGVDYSYSESYYTPFNQATDNLGPSGATLTRSGSDHYWQFDDAELGSGWYLAFEMVRFELRLAEKSNNKSLLVSHPTWAAAMLAIGSEYVRHEDVQKSIEHFCGDAVAKVDLTCDNTNSLVPCRSSLFEKPDVPPPDLNVGE